jgi:hypothetical protein
MAKAKKTDDKSESKPAAKKTAPPAKKPAAKKPAGGGGSPLINTDFAAQSAARMLLARKSGGINTETGRKESSTFKQMKDGLAKPHLSGMNNLLDSTATPGSNRTNQPFQQQNQRGSANTHGADVARTGVPRRTPG